MDSPYLTTSSPKLALEKQSKIAINDKIPCRTLCFYTAPYNKKLIGKLFLSDHGELLRSMEVSLQKFVSSSKVFLQMLEEPDWFVLDLEDGVPMNKKPETRELVRSALLSGSLKNKRVILRVNSLANMSLLSEDLRVCALEGVDSFILTMVNTAEDIRRYEELTVNTEKEVSTSTPKLTLTSIHCK
jgi:hypothetical protein